MRAIIKGADKLRSKLRRLGDGALEPLGPPLLATASKVLTVAVVSAPKDKGELAASGFVDGPENDKRHMSATVTAGFEAKHAPYVELGIHGGAQVEPPNFLANAAAAFEPQLAEAVGDALLAAIRRT